MTQGRQRWRETHGARYVKILSRKSSPEAATGCIADAQTMSIRGNVLENAMAAVGILMERGW